MSNFKSKRHQTRTFYIKKMEIVASGYYPTDIRTPCAKATSTPRARVAELFAGINKEFKVTPGKKTPDPMKKIRKFIATQSITTCYSSVFMSTMKDTPRGKKFAKLYQKN